MSFGSTGLTPILPSPVSCSRGNRPLFAPSNIDLPKAQHITQFDLLFGGGLTTPPVDNMSTTYQPSLAAYDSHGIHSYPSTSMTASRTKPAIINDSKTLQNRRYPVQSSQAQTHVTTNAQLRPEQFPSTTVQMQPSSHHSTRPSTPTSEPAKSRDLEGRTSRRGSETLIYHSLQIPKCISSKGGNLAEFAAQMTCFFWFESIDELKAAETIYTRSPSIPVQRLPVLAKPYEQFRKWVYSVLSTTQVTQNVVILALLFVYRLKMSTPQIKGRAGSEYRLLTVALMLGNKFLDDNTYTNKTWAEVSCFSVQEIHVMEVEFLSNMRYNLLASKEEWDGWLLKLASFHEYYDRALKLPASPIHAPSPQTKTLYSPIPSPTGTALPSVPEIMPFNPVTGNNLTPSSSQNQNWSAYQANAVSPLAAKPTMALPLSRKRSPEQDPTEHPAKRHVQHRLPPQVPNPRVHGSIETGRLPAPHLTLMTNHQQQQQQQQQQRPQMPQLATNGYAPQSVGANQGLVALPPLQPGMRAMSTVYQQPASAPLVQQQPTLPSTSGPAMPTASYPTAPLSNHAPMNYGTPTKRHSPGTMAPFGSSPMVNHFADPGSAVHTPLAHTPISNSPSFYLQQRASPYKPIRHVNRLLYPPPSASLDQYHLAVPVQPTQMHYQPLGRRNDVRTGVVPEFVLYNRGQHQPGPLPGGLQGPYGQQVHYTS